MTGSSHPLEQPLGFLQDHLADLVCRLSDYADEHLKERGLRDSDRTALTRLAVRLGRIAGILESQSRPDWEAASRHFKGKRGRAGWGRTCWNVARNEKGLPSARACADHLTRSGQHLADLAASDAISTAAAFARQAGEELVLAATAWNTATAWQGGSEKGGS